MFLGDREHSTRSARWIVNGQMSLGDRDFKQFNHQSYYFTGREVLSRFLSALLRKAAKQLFVNVSHLQRRKLIGTKF